MGGYGSGRRGDLPIVEDALKLDLRRLRRLGLFVPDGATRRFKVTWRSKLTVDVEYRTAEDEGWLRLRYEIRRSNGQRVLIDEQFALAGLCQPFGGYRWYMICPATAALCQCLFPPSGALHFRSRLGFPRRLQYRTQGMGKIDRVLKTRDRIRDRIMRATPVELRRPDLPDDFPPKPLWMRWSTYERQFARWSNCQQQLDTYEKKLVQRIARQQIRGR